MKYQLHGDQYGTVITTTAVDTAYDLIAPPSFRYQLRDGPVLCIGKSAHPMLSVAVTTLLQHNILA